MFAPLIYEVRDGCAEFALEFTESRSNGRLVEKPGLGLERPNRDRNEVSNAGTEDAG